MFNTINHSKQYVLFSRYLIASKKLIGAVVFVFWHIVQSYSIYPINGIPYSCAMYANVLEKEILLFFRGFLGLSAVVVAVVFLHALEPLCFAVKLDCFEFIFAFFALLERFTFFSLSLHAILFAIMKCACAFYFFFRNYVFLFVSTDCLCLCACSISFAIIIRLWIH